MPLNIDWQQILLHLFNFVLLFALLYFILYKPVHNFMEKREQHYRDRERDTQKALDDAAAQKAEYERLTADAERSLGEWEAARRAEVQASIEQELDAAQKQAAEIVASARVTAEAGRQQALQKAREEVAQLAGEMAKQIASDSTSDTYDRFLNEAERSEEHDG